MHEPYEVMKRAEEFAVHELSDMLDAFEKDPAKKTPDNACMVDSMAHLAKSAATWMAMNEAQDEGYDGYSRSPGGYSGAGRGQMRSGGYSRGYGRMNGYKGRGYSRDDGREDIMRQMDALQRRLDEMGH